ncbi:MAG TPA: CHAD domain-containing protein [Verrucomicrobiae bacterium]|nr:CHAD domain-containing protein [Verrucomicrobiae bacterium]
MHAAPSAADGAAVDAARHLLALRRNDFFLRWKHAVRLPDPERIHQLRVSSRRLREALLLFAPLLPPKDVPLLLKKVRKVTRSLGALRNLDEAAAFFSNLTDPAARDLASRFRRKRTAEVRRLGTLMQPRRRRKLRRHLAACIPQQRGATTFSEYCREALRGASSAVLELVPAAAFEEAADAQHELRIALKHYRYRVELAADAFPSGLPPQYSSCKEYQEILGILHDLDVFAAAAREKLRGEPRRRVLEAIGTARGRAFALFRQRLAEVPLPELTRRIGEGL